MDPLEQYRLIGKQAIACGSTQGIGRACAIQFARLGAAIALVARDESALRRVLAELPNTEGQQHRFICADFNSPDALNEKIRAHLSDHGPVHILLNNSGGPKSGPITEAKPDEFRDAFNRLVICNQVLAQAILPGMKDAKYGRIINIISTSVKEPIQGLGVSNTIRAAVANWAKTLSVEVAPFGITVNNILPGYTATARLEELIETRAKATNATKDQIRASYIAKIPVGRLADAEEIAAAAGFLASPAAAYVTGINLPVDGGRMGCL
jgi:3-oxoacyl-[acyl-carrier protein] reductase